MKRDIFWDSLKFVLIFLVVYGHTMEYNLSDGSFNRAMWNFIYTFHMPLFVFISGRFSHIHSRERYIQGIVRLVETTIVFQIIWSIFRVTIFGEQINYTFITQPYTILWYLVALIYWRVMVLFIPKKVLAHKKKIIFASFMICFLSGFIPVGHDFVIQRTLVFLPFFALGYYSEEVKICEIIRKIPPPLRLWYY